jgi:hypothetical protein
MYSSLLIYEQTADVKPMNKEQMSRKFLL